METLRCTYIVYCGLVVKWRSCFGNSFLIPYKPKHRYHMTRVRIHKQTNMLGPTGWLSGYKCSAQAEQPEFNPWNPRQKVYLKVTV